MSDNKEWVEDSRKGLFSRYSTDSENSVWICNECDTEGADPYEDGCEECGEESDS